VLRASAKVNLALEVLGKRADGYHEIATVLQAVDLFDRIAVETADSLSLHTDDPDLPTDEGNLVMRAARLLQKAAGIETGARIRLQKRIPVAAGLGGGSSDAAATLWGLSRLWKLRWPTARLQELAVELGMDVPFFLGAGRAVARGRGEQLAPLIERVLTDHRLRMHLAHGARDRAEHFTWQSVGDKIAGLYDSVLASSRALEV